MSLDNTNAHAIIDGIRTNFKNTEDIATFFSDHKDISDFTILGLSEIIQNKYMGNVNDYILNNIIQESCKSVILALDKNPHVKTLNLTSDWKSEKSLFGDTTYQVENLIKEVLDFIRNNDIKDIYQQGIIPFDKIGGYRVEEVSLKGLVNQLTSSTHKLEHLIMKGVKFDTSTYNEIRNYVITSTTGVQIHTDFSEEILQVREKMVNVKHNPIILELKFGTKLKMTVKGEVMLEKYFTDQNIIIQGLSKNWRENSYDFSAENGISGHISLEDNKVSEIWISHCNILSNYYSINYKDSLFLYDKKVSRGGRMSIIESGEIGPLTSVILEIEK